MVNKKMAWHSYSIKASLWNTITKGLEMLVSSNCRRNRVGSSFFYNRWVTYLTYNILLVGSQLYLSLHYNEKKVKVRLQSNTSPVCMRSCCLCLFTQYTASVLFNLTSSNDLEIAVCGQPICFSFVWSIWTFTWKCGIFSRTWLNWAAPHY